MDIRHTLHSLLMRMAHEQRTPARWEFSRSGEFTLYDFVSPAADVRLEMTTLFGVHVEWDATVSRLVFDDGTSICLGEHFDVELPAPAAGAAA